MYTKYSENDQHATTFVAHHLVFGAHATKFANLLICH